MTQSDEGTLKLIFLDLDGVANRWSNRPDQRMVEPECVEHLNAILDATGAKVVLTASRRHLVHSGDMTLSGLEYLLRSHGIRCSLVGVTEPDVEEGEGEPACRGQQISHYLRDHARPTRLAILDDEDDGISWRFLGFVKVNGSKGLTADDARRAIEILNG